MHQKPRVTVLVITYNHERFLANALDSVYRQRVPGGFEVIISEDSSTDGTLAIADNYARRFPNKTRLVCSSTNLNNNEVITRGLSLANGQYLALLDGDDFWIASDKLAIQANYLDHHPECTVCFHNVQLLNQKTGKIEGLYNKPNQNMFSGFEDLCEGNFIATCSVMYRAGVINAFPVWFYNSFGDWSLHFLHAEHGLIGYIPRSMGVYRRWAGGWWTGQPEPAKMKLINEFLQTIDCYWDYKYTHRIWHKTMNHAKGT